MAGLTGTWSATKKIGRPLAIVFGVGLVTRPIKMVILPMIREWVERRATRAAETRIL